MVPTSADAVISVRPMRETDLDVADRIMRLAFGTFIGLPDPLAFMGDASYAHTRWRTDPSGAFAATIGEEIVASNFATNWGSVGFFGPLTVRPDFWDRGVGRLLMEPVMDRFAAWGTRHAGLYTFPQSQKHLALYQKFGFWPRYLTAIMSAPVGRSMSAPAPQWSRYSAAPDTEQGALLDMCRQLTDAVYDGLDLRQEIASVKAQGLGDTVLLWDEGALAGLAICHSGPGTEAGSGVCYVKFGAVRPGPRASDLFAGLLNACDALAAAQGAARLVAGVNTSRVEAYRQMLGVGFRTDLQGVAMERGDDAGYNRPGVFVLDDWR